MDILNTFLVSNVSLCVIVLAAFFSLNKMLPNSTAYAPKRESSLNFAGFAATAMSASMISLIGFMFH